MYKVKPRDSHGRGQWVSFSRARVVDGFGIGAARGPPQANRRYVELLLADDSFIFNTLEWEMVDESPVEIKKVCLWRRLHFLFCFDIL